MRFLKTVSLCEASNLLTEYAPIRAEREMAGLEAALGRYLAEDIVSLDMVPYYDRSTVDGYAVVSTATQGASAAVPVVLRLLGSVPIGTLTEQILDADATMYVPTGGMIPQGADAMVMLEDTQMLEDLILIQKPAVTGANLIKRGEDVRPGQKVLDCGLRLQPRHLGVLAQLNIQAVPVIKPPSVFVITTGDEFAPFNEELGDGRIRDVNTYTIGALAKEAGFRVSGSAMVRDDLAKIKAVILEGMDCADLVLLSGGSSAGETDYTRQAIEELGGEILFHGIRLKPGKPTIGAHIGGKPIIGLPGHPVSAMTVFQTMVLDYVKKCTGISLEQRVSTARLAVNVPSQPGRLTCQFVTLTKRDGELFCQPYYSSSSLLSQLTNAQGYVMIPEETEGLEQGTLVEVILL